ncbi:28664_t:CDS:2 [Dentiscutata erythropus]|uniref:28664_t:CDS:1 n=1 Tax=Dentiscutata erythropus TaxID=1348616 RepID=A0A9N9DST2_9GLOM|nr:28664_t:CDS:2 [Dentiscutata erythropus]
MKGKKIYCAKNYRNADKGCFDFYTFDCYTENIEPQLLYRK